MLGEAYSLMHSTLYEWFPLLHLLNVWTHIANVSGPLHAAVR